jgi:hypothetical protein
VQQHPYGFADTRFDEVDVVEAVLGSQGSCMTFPDERGRAPTLRPLEAVSLHLVADSGKFSADRVQESKGQVAITQVGVVLRPWKSSGPTRSGVTTVRLTRPETVALRHAFGTRKSSTVPEIAA